jgi:uncharacterized membrane protein required for colicin V production
MDIGSFMQTVNIVDLVVVTALFGMFVLGFMQGAIRRLVGILTITFSFFLAAQLQVPLGRFLLQYWHEFPAGYAEMIGFLTVFTAAVIAFALITQGTYSRVHVFAAHPVIDEVLGGLLGVIEGGLLLVFVMIILDQFFLHGSPAADPSELPFLRDFWTAINAAATGGVIHHQLIPGLVAITSLLLPESLRATYAE